MLKIRPNLMTWQFSDYHTKHTNRRNLLVHIIAVPLFWIGLLLLIGASVNANGVFATSAIAALLISFVLQGIGHKQELQAPEPFLGPADFASRLIVEQLVTFPRFVISGGWRRALKKN